MASEVNDDSELFIFDLNLDNGIYRGAIELNSELHYVIISILYTTPIPEKKMNSVLEFISRLNAEHSYGSFIYDFEDDLVASQYCYYYIESEVESFEMQLTEGLHLRTVLLNFYLPGILSVAHSDKKPVDVLNELELEIDTDPRLN